MQSVFRMFQSFTRPSEPALRSCIPLDRKDTQETDCSCPWKVFRQLWSFKFQSFTVLSPEADARTCSTGEKATHITPRRCPTQVPTKSQSASLQIFTTLSCPPVAKSLSFGATTTQFTSFSWAARANLDSFTSTGSDTPSRFGRVHILMVRSPLPVSTQPKSFRFFGKATAVTAPLCPDKVAATLLLSRFQILARLSLLPVTIQCPFFDRSQVSTTSVCPFRKVALQVEVSITRATSSLQTATNLVGSTSSSEGGGGNHMTFRTSSLHPIKCLTGSMSGMDHTTKLKSSPMVIAWVPSVMASSRRNDPLTACGEGLVARQVPLGDHSRNWDLLPTVPTTNEGQSLPVSHLQSLLDDFAAAASTLVEKQATPSTDSKAGMDLSFFCWSTLQTLQIWSRDPVTSTVPISEAKIEIEAIVAR
mmetsp:Transcript_37494/g.82016  ORF Transcript_37494/g.82016 Transcript_37494/m.82016 type:complete len:419 (+) Transcript_37494:1018-2274(+)